MKHFKCIASAAAIVVASTTSGCSSSGICEDIVEVNRQEQVCQQLAKTMNDSRHPQQALTARKRHESECGFLLATARIRNRKILSSVWPKWLSG